MAETGRGARRWRKKPVVIEACCVPDHDDALAWGYLAGFLNAGAADWTVKIGGNGLEIRTLEGMMSADVGDWIICGVEGEFYPCKPDIFEATYEPEQP